MSAEMYVKPSIVFDMDDTICDWLGDALAVIEQQTGRKLTPESFRGGLWLEDVLTPDECACVLPAIFNQQFYLSLRPTPLGLAMASSPEAKALRKEFNFHVATARADALPKIALRVTEMWLHSHNVHVRGLTVTAPRASKVMASPASTIYFVDDSKSVAQDALHYGKKVMLINSVWNEGAPTHPDIIRVDPDEVIPYLADTLLTKSAVSA